MSQRAERPTTRDQATPAPRRRAEQAAQVAAWCRRCLLGAAAVGLLGLGLALGGLPAYGGPQPTPSVTPSGDVEVVTPAGPVPVASPTR